MYNEEETIGTVVTRTLRHVDAVICVDDGSSDASARIAEACGATVIRHRVNRGYGGALKTLFLHARELDVDALVVLDSDGQHESEDIPAMVEPILNGEADFTIGSRFVEGGGGTDTSWGRAEPRALGRLPESFHLCPKEMAPLGNGVTTYAELPVRSG